MSPEQIRCEPVDQRSDLYSMGVSLYEMVTGKLPFRGHSNYSVMSAHLQETPQSPIAVRPDLPKGLSDIILMAMAKNPRDRFQTAEAFAAALRSVFPRSGGRSASPIPCGGARSAGRAGRFPRRRFRRRRRFRWRWLPPRNREPRRGVATEALTWLWAGFLVVGMLVAGGFYVPRVIKTHAGSRSAAPQSETQPTAQSANAPADAATPVTPAAADVPAAAPAPELLRCLLLRLLCLPRRPWRSVLLRLPERIAVSPRRAKSAEQGQRSGPGKGRPRSSTESQRRGRSQGRRTEGLGEAIRSADKSRGCDFRGLG